MPPTRLLTRGSVDSLRYRAATTGSGQRAWFSHTLMSQRFGLLLTLGLTGCLVGPNYHRPATSLPEQFPGAPAHARIDRRQEMVRAFPGCNLKAARRRRRSRRTSMFGSRPNAFWKPARSTASRAPTCCRRWMPRALYSHRAIRRSARFRSLRPELIWPPATRRPACNLPGNSICGASCGV